MIYEINLATDNVVYGTLNLSTAFKILSSINAEVLSSPEFVAAEIGTSNDDEPVFDSIRKASICWLDKSEEAKALVDYLVKEINTGYFNLDISDSAVEYQYTVYSNPNDHYDWHQDYYPEDIDDVDFIRTLSISVCLTPDDVYDGAEFFIKDGNEANVRVFKMKFGDFIVFPSTCEHRVNALREGERVSLVVWYGHHKPKS